MINRREVIASGAGASLLAGAAAAGVVEASWGEKHFRGSTGGDAPMRTLPGAAVFIADPHSAAAQAAARGATASGARVRFLNTDNWSPIFAFETPLLELVARGTVLYFAILIFLRLMPRRTGGELALQREDRPILDEAEIRRAARGATDIR